MMYEMKYLIHPVREEWAEGALLLSPHGFKQVPDAEPSFAWSNVRKGVMLSGMALRYRETQILSLP